MSTDLLRRLYFSKSMGAPTGKQRDKKLVQMVIDHARHVIRHPSRPTVTVVEDFSRNPFGEVDVERVFEENPMLGALEGIPVDTSCDKPFTCVALLDSSSSMAGEKHLLASIAVAVLLLEVPARDVSLILFSSEAKVIKPLLTEESTSRTLMNFLATEPMGFTNIGKGLRAGLKQYQKLGSRRRVGLIATDGRTTEGEDPFDVAKGYDFLVVLHLHGPGSHLDSSRAIAQAGHGHCLEVNEFQDLPKKLYDAVRLVARV